MRAKTIDPELDAHLTGLLGDAAGALYGQRGSGLAAVITFVGETFPAAVWHLCRQILAAAALLVIPALIMATWIGVSDQAQSAIPPALAESYVEEDFEAYYSSEAAAEFATRVFVNNIWVSFLAYSLGIAFCAGTAFVLIQNSLLLGQAAGLFAASGQLDRFFGLILPHGCLELSAIVVAGGAGFALGWAIIAPGDRTRIDALAEEGRRSVVVVVGLIVVFLAAALIEGFVTGSPLSTLVRVGIGVGAWLAFTLYIVVFGRAAAARGLSGMWGESRPSWTEDRTELLSSRATVALAASATSR